MHELPPEQPAPLHLLQQAAEAYAAQNHQLELRKYRVEFIRKFVFVE